MKSLFEVESKYYKKKAWIQPTLNSNGSFGDNEMGVEAYASGSYTSQYNLNSPYLAFSPNNNYISIYADEYIVGIYINVYIPTPIVLTNFSIKIKHTGSSSSSAYNVTIWGDESKNSKTDKLLFINSIADDDTIHTYTINTTTHYQYYTLYAKQGGYAYEDSLSFSDILLEGFQPIAGSKNDHDYAISHFICKTPKINNVYYAVKD